MLKYIFLCLCLICLISVFKSKEIPSINKSNFSSSINTKKLSAIFLYESHKQTTEEENQLNKNLLKVVEDLSESETISKYEISFYKFNIKENPELIKELRLKDFPRFVFFNNERNLYSIFEGTDFTLETLEEFLKDYIEMDIREMKSLDDLTNKKILQNDKDERILVFLGDINKYHSEYVSLMNSAMVLKIKNLFYSNDQRILSNFDVINYDGLVFNLHQKHFERLNLTDEDFKSDYILENLIQMHLYDNLMEYSQLNEHTMLEGVNTFVLVHKYSSQEFEEVKEAMGLLSKEYRKELNFLHAHSSSTQISTLRSTFKFSDGELPVAIITSFRHETLSETLDKYKLSFAKNKPNYESLSDFIKNWKNGVLDRYYVSEDIPAGTYDEHGIMKMDRNSFYRVLNFDETDANYYLCFVCSKRFGEICEKSRKTFHNVSKMFKTNKNLKFVEVDPDKNELDFLRVTTLPKIFLLPSKGIKSLGLFVYHGYVDTRHLATFVKSHVDYPLEVFLLPNEEEIVQEEREDSLLTQDLDETGEILKKYKSLENEDLSEHSEKTMHEDL